MSLTFTYSDQQDEWKYKVEVSKDITNSEREPYRKIGEMFRQTVGGAMAKPIEGAVAAAATSIGEHSRRKERKRKRKAIKSADDDNKPKRPTPAFFLFAKGERPKVKDANPRLNRGEVAKELGRRWRDLNAEQQQEFREISNKYRQIYYENMKAYKETMMEAGSADPIAIDMGDEHEQLIETEYNSKTNSPSESVTHILSF